LVTNLGVSKCANAASAYKESTVYAWQKLNLPNVAIYPDAGHAGWLGWAGMFEPLSLKFFCHEVSLITFRSGNLQPTAELYGSLYNQAGKPKAVRGLATNVSNYNGYRLSSPPSYTSGNNQYDESKFHAALTPYLQAQGFPANFIVDLGRAGVQPGGRVEWGHWCNIKNSGFGPRPTEGGNTGESGLDAVVWVKPGGESDGSSDSSAPRFDSTCVSASAFTPAPQAGTWFEAYFEMLLKNANPSFG
jgi:cellulose 1,4-beta-cellobiosidase